MKKLLKPLKPLWCPPLLFLLHLLGKKNFRDFGNQGGRDGRKNDRKPRREPRAKPEFDQKIIDIRRVTRVASGGRRFSFSVAIVAGNRKGSVGVGIGKAGDTSLLLIKLSETHADT